ncbi:penicillin-binding protein [Enemella evansiae]|uniref:penicillin-binding transpeptidase domain-containing protein n=1 Tax=Enemella evansiae TaxID=2016499 RepID=UPI000B96C30F|nr:penicillin-binding transpeptidase domain-containing protein [Enemella evansiae]OYO11189.1 penicillin-binding protein [Enemella evansiae]
MLRSVRRPLALAGAAALLSGCAAKLSTPPVPKPPDPAPQVQALIDGLQRTDLSQVPADQDAAGQLAEIVRGMDGVKPMVTVTGTKTDGDVATVDLDYSWPFAGQPWTYRSTATLNYRDGQWVLDWTPQLVHPQLGLDTRLVHTNTPATRGRITGKDSAVIAEDKPVLRVGIDKSRVDAARVEDSARRLAQALQINPDNYLSKVRAGGPAQFVEAITLRPEAAQNDSWRQIPGAIGVPSNQTLVTDKEFAPELIGTTGPATPEVAAASGYTLFPGDETGISGLQKRDDAQLRGKPGTKVSLVPRTMPTPAPTASPSAGPSASPSAATPSPAPMKPVTLFEAPAQTGGDVALSLDLAAQRKAEQVLSRASGSASLVAIQPSTGKIVAAANAAGNGGNPDATFGRYAPGSTFKVVTTLALLRSGMTPDSPVNCTDTVTVDGRTFKNYSDFPASKVGRLSLADAVAYSCNTALIAESQRISPQVLREAAASLGLGTDYDAGFSSFFGSVPDPANVVGKAESLIGQGTVEASPMAMAAVAASVQAGRTVIPTLVAGNPPPQPSRPLTADEASALQRVMRLVVSQGTASFLSGTADGAKTGTAEYGTATPPRTHAWMIAYRGDLAVAVWVNDGESGSKTAGPLIQAFLR